jgi:hypothetical protein
LLLMMMLLMMMVLSSRRDQHVGRSPLSLDSTRDTFRLSRG